MEIALAVIQNIVTIGISIGVVLIVSGVILSSVSAMGMDTSFGREDKVIESLRKAVHSKKLIIVGCWFCLLGLIPSVDQVWQMRISLIKLELSNPENVKSSVEHIDKIVNGLECKYLNQCNKKVK